MKEVEALRPLTYGTRRLRAGERFTASDAYARLMSASGRVRVCGEPAPALAALEDVPAVAARRKRTYKRRDLRAED